MRKIGLVALVVLALGAFALIVPASASQNTQSGPRWSSRPGVSSSGVTAQAPGDAFVVNDSFLTKTFNHFGNPSLGSAIGETWLESGLDSNLVATNLQGVARGILLPKAVRVSLVVELRGADANDVDQLVAKSSKVNSSGKLTIQVKTPEITLATDPRCSYYTRVTMGIRWSDGRLSTVVFEQELNLVPGGPTACTQPA